MSRVHTQATHVIKNIKTVHQENADLAAQFKAKEEKLQANE